MELSKQFCMLLILSISVYMDFRYYKIKNALIIAGICIGSLHNFFIAGGSGIIDAVVGGVFPIGVLAVLYFLAIIGAGDIKIFSVIGCFYGISFCFQSIVVAFIIGAIISFFTMLRRRILHKRIQYFLRYILNAINTRQLIVYYHLEADNKEAVIHFSLPIAFSVIFLIFHNNF